MFRRHPFLSILGICCFIVLVAAAVFTATFDLNRYRDPLQAELSRRLSEPVQLGEAHLSLLHGPSVKFSDVVVGPRGGEGSVLRVKHLYLQMEFWPLFEGHLAFRRILVDAPRLRLVLNPAPHSEPKGNAPPPLSHTAPLFLAEAIRSLVLHNGTIHFIDRRNPARPFSAILENINGTFANLSLQKPTELHFSADLKQGKAAAPLSLTGTFTPGPTLSDWSHHQWDMTIHFGDLAPASFLQHYVLDGNLSARGEATVDLSLHGTAAAGLAVKASLVGNGLDFRFPRLYRRPLELTHLSCSGIWSATAGADRFTDLAVATDGLEVRGALTASQKSGSTYLEGTLSSSALPVLKLIRYLPDEGSPAALSRVRQRLRKGTLQLTKVRFAGPISAFRHLNENFPLQSAQATLEDGVVSLPQSKSLTAVSVTAVYADHRLTLEGGHALLGKTPIRFKGSLNHPFLPAPAISLEASGTVPVEEAMPYLPGKLPEGLRVDGALPLALTLGGTTNDLLASVHADLTPLALRFKQQAAKPAGVPGDLSLSAELSSGRLSLKKGTLKIAPLELQVSGDYQPAGKTFRVAIDVPGLDLARLLPRAPILAELRPRGEISLHYRASGAAGKIRSRGGRITLHNFGIHLTGVIADLSQANGQILLSAKGARFKNVTAKLGSSPLHLRGTLADFAHPRLKLDVRAATIRGDGLFFFSKSALLHDLDAHLVIDRHHLAFAPATVFLNGGTKATVRGTIAFVPGARVNLDIESDQADIDQVIDLWQGPPAEKKPKEKKRAQHGSLFILAKAKKGTLGDLHFERAEGEITLHDGALLIQPLHFYAGKGYFTGQVVVDHSAGAPPLLKISGHLENFDAAAIYRQLLKKRGLITGTMKGDFYLQGRAGKDFLPTSMGGFNMEVKKGVLHKFQFLSKVFSLLNVSQILTFKLPDMSLEGMPFTRLKGSFTLRRGVLSTNDLFVDSNAMNLSLVGQMNLQDQKVDLILGVKPLKTVDKIITHIPLAGWILTGKQKALITAYFKIRGKSDDPGVTAIPITSISDQVFGIFKRIFGLPGKVITDMGELLKQENGK